MILDARLQKLDEVSQAHACQVLIQHPVADVQHLLEMSSNFRREALVALYSR